MSTHPDDPNPVPGRTSSPAYDESPPAGAQGDHDPLDTRDQTAPDLHEESYVRTAPHPRAEGWDGSRDLHDREVGEHETRERDGRDREAREREARGAHHPHDPNRTDGDRTTDEHHGPSAVDGAVESLAKPDNRAKLLLAIAAMSALTLLLVLVMAIDRLAEDGADPVLVDGVPCLVEEGEDDRAVLYCQR